MRYSVVTNQKIISHIKNSRYFKRNLGIVSTVEGANSERVYNDRDKFAYFYNTQYKTTIYGQGNVGDIMFYMDYYIRQDVLAVYLNNEEFIFEFDEGMMKEKGADFYIGHILKEVELKYEERFKEAEPTPDLVKEANPDLVMQNPGSVSYADLQAYLKKKQAERYSVQSLPKQE
jgi:hypothetical protein